MHWFALAVHGKAAFVVRVLRLRVGQKHLHSIDLGVLTT
jgi:hypothetical protein